MFIHFNLDSDELIDLLALHTNRLMQIMFYGETYSGEYHTCKTTIELIQKEIMLRQAYTFSPVRRQDQAGIRQQ